MKFLFLFSGENPLMAKAELESVLIGENVKFKMLYFSEEDRVGIYEIEERDDLKRIFSRLILTHKVFTYLYHTIHKDFISYSQKFKWESIIEVPYYVKVTRVPQGNKALQGIREKIADIIWYSLKNPKVDVRNPKNIIELIVTPKKVFVGKLFLDVKALRKDLKSRNPEKRPIFHPAALRPKEARLLINFARVKPKDLILDPFCGAGSILIEACLMGIKSIGIDINADFVEGAKINLEHYCKEKLWEVYVGDATKLSRYVKEKVDAIVTDPPYGRSSKGTKELEILYKEFLDEAYNVLKDKKCISMFVPHYLKEYFEKIASEKYKILYTFNIYVHKSLTRVLYVLQKD